VSRFSPVPRWLPIATALAVLFAIVLGLGGRHASVAGSESTLPVASHELGSPSLTPSTAGATATVQASASAGPSTSSGGTPSPAPAGSRSLDELLGMLTVADEVPTGYDRDLFPEWSDADGDGCNTRREVLIDEAIVAPTVGAGCSLTGGEWRSRYDGLVFHDAADLQIDHVVALAEAWDSGARAWTTTRGELFANDLDVPWTLIAVSGATNEAKADSDPADWLPPDPGAICPFVADWIAIKARWGLSVDTRELAALQNLVEGCPGYRRAYVPGPQPDPPPPPPPSGGGCSPAYPGVCIPPPPPDLDCRDIPYRRFAVLPPDPHHFDGDHDGIGCEGP